MVGPESLSSTGTLRLTASNTALSKEADRLDLRYFISKHWGSLHIVLRIAARALPVYMPLVRIAEAFCFYHNF